MDFPKIKSERCDEYIHMNENETSTANIDDEAQKIWKREFFIKYEIDEKPQIHIYENEKIITKIEEESCKENYKHKELITESEAGILKIKEEFPEEESNTMEYKIIREKLDNDGNEAVCPKIEEEFSEDENKTIIHQLIGADGKY
ncbi:hypothetical protein HHI36_020798 [Cryptolaemus montrouzieri]|uniref:Uncharacterized protein n=1 Tax=Cryptolaemus montrouzieri TaxID=559131 RepID=A0ABD2NBT6_9CUCU